MPSSRAVWFAALLGALSLPFFLVDVPPVLDYPNHLARFFVLAHPDDPVLSRFYAPHWAILPNLGFDLLGPSLLKILPVHVAGRILLFTSLIAPVAGVMAYSKAAFGRVTGWAFAAGAAAFNGVFFLGFMNFLLSLGLAFGGAALWMVLRRRGQWAAAITGALCAVLIFFCHIFGLALFALLIGSQEIERLWPQKRDRQNVFVVIGLLAMTLAPALLLYALSPLSGATGATGEWQYWRKGWELFTPFMTYSKPLTLLTGAALFGFLILGWRGARFAPGARLALLVLAILFLAAPDSFKGGSFVSVRLALMLGLMLFAGIAPAPRFDKRVGFALAGFIVAQVATVTLVWADDYSVVLMDIRHAMARIPPGAKVLAVQGPADRAAKIPDLYRLDSHLPALLVIERRAFWPLLFADPGQQPLIVRPPYDLIAQPRLSDLPAWDQLRDPAPSIALSANPYMKNWRSDFDYVLLITPPGTPTNPYFVNMPKAVPVGLVPLYSGYGAALWRIAH